MIHGGVYRETAFRRANLTGTPYQCIRAELDGEGQRSRANLSQGGVLATTDQNADAVQREVRGIHSRGSTDWHGWRRNCIAGVGDFDETKSIFNKEKWLPLCRDTQFKISHQCCGVMKKSPLGIYQRRNKVVPFLGTLADESRLRTQAWLRHGCNAYEGHKKTSQPLSFWLEQDILHYILQEDLEIASVYGDIVAVDEDGYQYEPLQGMDCTLKCTGCNRTGCVYCCFGLHSEKGETRFQRLARTHPKLYEYSIGGGQWVENPDYDPVAPKMDGDWLNWNPKKIWVPSKKGLGMKKVFDDCNAIYGKNFIRYE